MIAGKNQIVGTEKGMPKGFDSGKGGKGGGNFGGGGKGGDYGGGGKGGGGKNQKGKKPMHLKGDNDNRRSNNVSDVIGNVFGGEGEPAAKRFRDR